MNATGAPTPAAVQTSAPTVSATHPPLLRSATAPAAPSSKGSLADALRDMDLGGGSVRGSQAGDSVASSSARSLLPEEVLPSEFVKKVSYQDQQDVPDEIAGLLADWLQRKFPVKK